MFFVPPLTRLDTGVGGLILSDQYLQLATRLPSHNLYGFGENLHRSFRHSPDTQPRLYPAFARDVAPTVSDEQEEQQQKVVVVVVMVVVVAVVVVVVVVIVFQVLARYEATSVPSPSPGTSGLQ